MLLDSVREVSLMERHPTGRPPESTIVPDKCASLRSRESEMDRHFLPERDLHHLRFVNVRRTRKVCRCLRVRLGAR